VVMWDLLVKMGTVTIPKWMLEWWSVLPGSWLLGSFDVAGPQKISRTDKFQTLFW
jgi:hypothetical protein